MRAFLRSYWTPAGKQAAWNLLWMVAFLGWSNACSIGITFLLTRGLSQETYGLLAYLLTLQTLVLVLGAGTRAVQVREGTRRPELLDALATSHFLVAVVVAVGGGAMALAYIAATQASAIMAAAVVLFVGNLLFSLQMPSFFDVHHRQAVSGLCTAVGDTAALGLAFLLWRNEQLDLTSAAACYALRWGLTSLLQIATYDRCVRRLRLVVDRRLIADIIRASWPLTVTYLLGAGGAFLVMELLVRGAGEAPAALYAIGVQVATVEGQLTLMAVRIVQPHVAGRHGMSRSFVLKLAVFYGGFVALSGAVVATLGWAFIEFLLPSSYAPAVTPMLLLMGGAMLSGVWQLLEAYLVTRGRVLGSPLSLAAWLAVTIGMLTALGDFSATGAATASLAGSAAMTAVAAVWLLPRGKQTTADAEMGEEEIR